MSLREAVAPLAELCNVMASVLNRLLSTDSEKVRLTSPLSMSNDQAVRVGLVVSPVNAPGSSVVLLGPSAIAVMLLPATSEMKKSLKLSQPI